MKYLFNFYIHFILINNSNTKQINLMKQTIIHDRSIIPQKISNQFRKSIEYHRDRQQNLIRHKKYKINHGSTKHKSIYSLAIQSNILINDIDFNPPKAAQSLIQQQDEGEQNGIHNERKSRQSSSIGLSKDIKLQRYSRNERSMQKKMDQYDDEFDNLKHNREKISLLKRIIQHYNIKSLESSYYSNLMNNLGIKVSGASDMRSRFANVKTNSIKFQKEDSKLFRHQRSVKIKHSSNPPHSAECQELYNNSLMKIQAQSINHLIKYESEQKSIAKRQLNGSRQEKMRTTKNLRKTNHSVFKAAKKEIFRNENISSLKCYQNGDNCISIKVNKYKEFIFIINLANNIYRDLDVEKYEFPFKIFVGFGNNSNLIKGIIKKRFWFQTTKNKEEAHFIWTQLKDEEIFSNQIKKYEQKQLLEVNDVQDNLKAKVHHHHSSVNFNPQAHEKTLSTLILESSQNSERDSSNKGEIKNEESPKQQPKTLKVNTKNIEVFNPYSKILSNEQSNTYMNLITEVSYKKKFKFGDRMRYMKPMKYINEEELGSQIIHNHLPFNGLLGNKKAMYYMMKEYCKLTNKKLFQIVPLTFHIKRGLMDDQFKQFMLRFNENKANKRQNYWIMKPGEFSNRGQGISCTSKAEEVRAKINNLKKLGKNKSLILQQYITNPLLYNGRKFDIRTYMLISINNGKIRAYWYQDGYIRTSSYMWRLDEIQDTYIHLTNDAIQKYSSDYGKYEPANKLTYSELQRYLDTLPKTSSTKYNFQNEVYPKLRDIALDAVKASFQFLHPDRRANNFQIFGFDFMIDAHFKPWLIQINTNPCLQVNCLVLERIIPSMIQNAFRIGLDPIFPPPLNYSSTYKYNIPENALHYNKFQLIFDEERDGAKLIELYRQSKVIQSMDDYEEDKQTYEQEGQEINLEEN